MRDWTDYFSGEDRRAVLDTMVDLVDNDEEEAFVFGSGEYYAHLVNRHTAVKIYVLKVDTWQAIPQPVFSGEVDKCVK